MSDNAELAALLYGVADIMPMFKMPRKHAVIVREAADALSRQPSEEAVSIAKWALDPNYEGSAALGDGIKIVLREILRLAGKGEKCEAADALSRQPSEEAKHLMRFYAVDTLEGLVKVQAEHVESLQAKLPALRDTEPRNPRKG